MTGCWASGRVYPRACGGTKSPTGRAGAGIGLSPRVRGNRLIAGLLDLFRGSIPARAGEPECVVIRIALAGVYPRACGGTRCALPMPGMNGGLSPRVRGNLPFPGQHLRYRGSIPARAGEPRAHAVVLYPVAVYPRACGGTSQNDRMLGIWTGLSPRVRGNQIPHGAGRGRYRSIPARAGEPGSIIHSCASGRVYPRACGGTGDHAGAVESLWGLSPRVRGNHGPASLL